MSNPSAKISLAKANKRIASLKKELIYFKQQAFIYKTQVEFDHNMLHRRLREACDLVDQLTELRNAPEWSLDGCVIAVLMRYSNLLHQNASQGIN